MPDQIEIRIPDIGDFEDVEIVEILVGPGATISNPLALLGEVIPEQRDIYFPVEQFIYFNYRWSSTVITFDPERDAVRVVFTEAETGADGRQASNDCSSKKLNAFHCYTPVSAQLVWKMKLSALPPPYSGRRWSGP